MGQPIILNKNSFIPFLAILVPFIGSFVSYYIQRKKGDKIAVLGPVAYQPTEVKEIDKENGKAIVKVDTEEKEQKIKVIVEDDGKGINEEDKEKIFEKGYKTAESGGSGLGLYLVKEIAETYGGSVEVKDSNLGGARFEVQLKKK